VYEHILIPTDGSRGAKKATRQAIEMASQNDSTLHGLYVINTGELGFAATPDDISETKARLRRRGEEVLADLADQAETAGVPVVTDVASGITHEEILEYVAENGIDLVVMGKHGYLDPDSHVLGSVTQRVMRGTKIPVQAV